MPNTPVRAAAEGMPDFTRRRLLGGIAAVSAAGAATAAATVQPLSARERAERAWSEFCAAVEDLVPSDCRIQMFGSHEHGRKHPSFRIVGMTEHMEQVHPRVRMPVERTAIAFHVGEKGWTEEDTW